MKRTLFKASLVGSAAAGLLAVTTPAWAQATTYPEGTDCSAISNSASRTDCLNQMNESRQNQTQTPDSPDNNSLQPGDQPSATQGDTQNAPTSGGDVGSPGTSGSGTDGTGDAGSTN